MLQQATWVWRHLESCARHELGEKYEFTNKKVIFPSSLQKIADNPPTFIRFSIGNKTYEQEIPTYEGKKMAEAARCILQ